MKKEVIIKLIEETRDSAGRLRASKLDPRACVEFARKYATNEGDARDMYSFDQVAANYGVNTDFATKVVKRAVAEAMIPYRMSEMIMIRGSSNQIRHAYFKGNHTPTERTFAELIFRDRFEALKKRVNDSPDMYGSLWRNFLSPKAFPIRRLKNRYGMSTREVLYFVMIAAIRDMPDASYDLFQKVLLDYDFLEIPFYADIMAFIEQARDTVKISREKFLQYYNDAKQEQNKQDPDFMAEYAAAKQEHYAAVAEIISEFEAKLELFRMNNLAG